jgi:hypothetical protein
VLMLCVIRSVLDRSLWIAKEGASDAWLGACREGCLQGGVNWACGGVCR